MAKAKTAKKKATGKTRKKTTPKRASGVAAKNGKTRDGQKLIPGTYDSVPTEVQESIDNLLKITSERMKKQQRENTLRADTLQLMKKHDVQAVEVSADDILMIEHSESDKLVRKTRKEFERLQD